MNVDALLVAALRTVPLALCLPLPGLFARLALGIVLATCGASAESPLHALATGVALGLFVGGPVWAARSAGLIVGRAAFTRSLDALYATLAWLVFFAAGGAQLLMRAVAMSLPMRSIGETGTQLVALAARLALPTLLALAVVEILAAVAERVEGAAELPLDAHRMASATRPLLAVLLLLSGLASFAHGVAQAMR